MATKVIKHSFFSKLFGAGGTIGAKLWKVFKYIYLIALGILLVFQSVIESYKEKSPYPFINELGGKILSPDEQNYYLVKELETSTFEDKRESSWQFWKTSFFQKGTIYYNILVNIGSLVIIFWLLYRFVWLGIDESQKWSARYKTLITMALMQMLLAGILFSAFILDSWDTGKSINDVIPDYKQKTEFQRGVEIGRMFIPFKGTALVFYKFGKGAMGLVKKS